MKTTPAQPQLTGPAVSDAGMGGADPRGVGVLVPEAGQLGDPAGEPMDEIAAQVRAILAERLGRDPLSLSPEDTFESLGLDSLAQVETVFALEEAFDVSLPFAPDGREGGGAPNLAALIAAITALHVKARGA